MFRRHSLSSPLSISIPFMILYTSLAMVFKNTLTIQIISPQDLQMVGVARTLQWLEALLEEKFFRPCLFHEFEKKCEKNTFCLDCCVSLCPRCLPLHPNHNLLQIRRYVYRDVIQLKDAQKLTDCSSVQPYITNRAKVVFIHHKPISRPFRGLGNSCAVCDRSLQEPYLFCSLSCKAYEMRKRNVVGKDITRRHSIFELTDSLKSSSSRSISTSSKGVFNFSRNTLACMVTNDFSKKKRSHVTSFCTKNRVKSAFRCEYSSESFMRRKGVPHRSPLY